jgi:outer membrane receptor for ferrienterochelin and colicins
MITANNSLAQEVIGNVLDNRGVVPFATIMIDNGKGVQTDENGAFALKLPHAGSYTLTFSAVGYQKVIRRIIIDDLEKIKLDIELSKSNAMLDEVVVTGTMKASTVSESPAPIQVLRPAFFKSNPTPSVFEAIGMVNGIRPQINCNVCSTGDIHINGMEGPYTMVLIDGMPIVSALSTVYGLMGIPNSLVKRIEVMKGPASTLYGSEAVGGLINILTKSPDTASKLSFDVNTTTYLEKGVDVAFSLKKNKISALFAGNYFGLNKRWDINNDNFTDIPTVDRFSIFNKVKIGKKQPLDLAFRYVHENRFGGELQWKSQDRGGDMVYGESIYTNRMEILSKYALPISGQKVDFQFSYNKHDQNSVYGNTTYLANQQVVFTQLVWDKRLNTRNDALIGLAFRSTIYDDNTSATENGEYKNEPSVINLPGFFAQNETEFNDKFKILTGLRLDYNTSHGIIFSPRLNVKYSAPENGTFRLSLGNGYRAVNIFSEDHAALTGARKVEIKPNLSPEQSYNVNLDYHKFWTRENGFAELQLNAFYTYFDNKIIANYDIDPELIVYDNLSGFGISKGLAVNSSFSILNQTNLELGATYMQVYNQQDDERLMQIQTPNFTGNAMLSHKFPKYDLSFNITGNITSPMRLPVVPEYGDKRSPFSPWFTLINAQLRKNFKTGVELYTGVKNIFNYIPPDPIFRPDDPFGVAFDPSYNFAPLQGRRAFFGIRYSL